MIDNGGWLWLVVFAVVLGVVMIVTGGTGSRARAERAGDRARLIAVDRKLDAVIAHLGMTLPEPQYPEVLRLVQQGQKIQAIKVYREQSGVDLRTARDFVEELARRHGL